MLPLSPNVFIIVASMISMFTLLFFSVCNEKTLIDPLNHSCEQQLQTYVGPLLTVVLNMSIKSLNDLLFRCLFIRSTLFSLYCSSSYLSRSYSASRVLYSSLARNFRI